MTEHGIKADYKHDYSESSKYQPRHLATFAERGDANGVIGDQDPFWIVSGPSGDAATDGFVKIGIADGTGSWPDIGTAAYIKLENGKVTVNPGIVLNPVAQGSAPAVAGSLIYNTSTGELNYHDSSGWNIVSAGGLSAHVLDDETYHTATGLTVGWVVSADSPTTFSWKAPTGGMTSHDLTGALHTEDATGGSGNVIVADSGTTFSWQQLDYTELASIPSTFDPIAHDLTSAYHTDSGLTGGHFLKADTTTTFSWQAHGLGASDVGAYTTAQVDSAIDTDISTHAGLPNAHHAQSHTLAGSDHTATGLTVGWVIAADSSTTFSWQAPSGGGPGSGTQWTLPVWDTTSTLGDSMISQDSGGTLATVDGDLYVANQVGIGITAGSQPLKTYTATAADAIYLDSGGVWSGIASSTALYLKAASYIHLQSTATNQHMFFDCGGTFTFRDQDNGDATVFTIDAATGDVQFDGTLTVDTIAAGVADYNAFLVSDSGVVKFRTGAEVLSDIGAATVPLALTDLASYVQGSTIIGGGADWEALAAGTEDYVLKMGASEPAWGTVDWSELTGTQPAPVAHVLATTGPHSGTLPWTDLNKTGSSLADLATRAHSNLSDAPTTAHQDEASVTAVPLTISGQAITFNYNTNHFKLTGNNLEVGTDTPGTDEVLTWSGSAVVWSTPSVASHGASAHTGDVIPAAHQDFGGYNIVDVGKASIDSLEKAGFTTGVNHIRVDGTTDSDHFIRFRGGGSTVVGVAGTCYSLFGANHWFFYVDRGLIAGNYPMKIAFCSTSSETPDPDGNSTDIITMHASGDVSIDNGDLTAANIITAGNVDGVDVSEEPARISTEIDTDISTHAGLATVHQNAPSLISTHASDDNAHHEVIETSDVEGIITAELVGGQSIDNAIDSLINSHAGDDDAHHALVTVAAYPLALTGQQVAFRYDVNFFKLVANSLVVGTDDPETDDILTWDGTDAVWGPSAGGMSAHDLTGAYHTEDATGGAGNVLRASGATTFAWATLAHGDLSDAPSSAHHTRYADAEAVAAVDEHLVLGSANATWINCPYEGAAYANQDQMTYHGKLKIPVVATLIYMTYSVPLPTTRGGKSLYLNGTRVSLSGANSGNRITSTRIYGMADTTNTSLDDDPTNKNSVALWTDTSMGNKNLGGYDAAKIVLKGVTTTADVLEIQYVTVRYYYA